ncbi:family 43 glycosylhydrolase [Dyadobacter sp. CY326]|uniref:family 43 glycosylhydrolase n=1 Tax=Dyadobacter sp. CY326 TaxID=2907300 RepID=UPI001F248A57|nr:family 43 glycosylhydrolase [Dyadobacter sp. CY326]MCE7064950.1 family 43 glycosylhydrolase [Dyadobacter sp. CY326]
MRFVLLVIFTIVINLASAQQAVIPGDFPDPSVIKFKGAYYATATSSNWAPSFPILKSTDLKKWEQVGYIFPKLTSWADYYYWAPELNVENGKVYVYYTAHKKDGNLCVGVASADSPEGPYKDHGPLVCEADGSIDGFPMRDENNKLHLIWKEDGNSIGQPTPIWIQPLNEERTALIGEKKELFRNDTKWEGNLVEGVSIVKNNGYFYAIYAAAGCCGSGCTYATGVARSKKLAGPWEKYENNPILNNQEKWVCPGHGTALKYNGKNYFMYHAYDKESNKYTGRQGLIQEFEFTKDNWIKFSDKYLSADNMAPVISSSDDFETKMPSLQWNWSVYRKPALKQQNGKLNITLSDSNEIYLGKKVLNADYEAIVEVIPAANAAAGVALIGDDRNMIYAAASKDSLSITALKDGITSSIANIPLNGQQKNISVRLSVKHNTDLQFAYSLDGGYTYIDMRASIPDVSYLPPWDRALRIGIVAKGTPGTNVAIERFDLK